MDAPSPITRLRRSARDWRRSRAAVRRAGSRGGVVALVASLVALGGLVGALYLHLAPESPGRRLTYDRLADPGAGLRPARVTLLDEDARIDVRLGDGRRYWVAYPKSDAATAALIDDLVAAGVEVDVDGQPSKAAARMALTTLLPLVVLANLFALVVVGTRGGSSAIGEVITFGSIGQRRLRRGQERAVSFADVGAAEEAVVELREVVDYLSDPSRYEALGAAPPKGVLLVGPPGCGKTLLAKAVAGEAGVPFVSVAGAEFVESLVGVGAARVRDLFARVRAVAPAIVFIDELDAAGRRRGTGEGGSEERDQTLNQLLVEMDGFDVSKGIVVMAATNRPDIIDPALLRPGRFDRHVTIPLPDPAGRREILALHARARPLAPGIDLDALARRTAGFSGADLANVVNEATLLAIRDGRDQVRGPDMDEAVRRVESGPQRRGQVLSDDERLRLATYEAGRAVVAVAVGRGAGLHRVSILDRPVSPGGPAGADADAALLTASQLRARIVAAMGGPAAERATFGELSTRAEADIQEATSVARDLVARFGMSGALGPVRLAGAVAEHLGVGGELSEVSEATRAAVDAEVRAMVEQATATAAACLAANSSAVDGLVSDLLSVEHLEGADLATRLEGVAPAAGDESRASPSPRRRHRPAAASRR